MSATDVLQILERYGPRSTAELASALGISRSATQRQLAACRGSLLVTGRARATRYAARRTIEAVATPVRVHEVDPEGEVRHALTLHPVEPFGFFVESCVPEVPSGFEEIDPADPGPDPAVDLPWLLHDIKPSGFLGRAWVGARLRPGFPGQLSRWTGDHVLRYALRRGSSGRLPGR